MPQNLHPNDDVSNSNWNPSTIHTQISQESGEAVTDNLLDPFGPPGGVFEVHMDDGVDPERHDDHKLIIELKGEYEDEPEPEETDLYVHVALMDGSSVILTETYIDPPDEYTRYEIALTEQQAQAISDYSDLRVEVTAEYIAEIGGGPGGEG